MTDKKIEFPKYILYLNLCTGEYEKIKVDVKLFSEISLSVFKDKFKWNLNKANNNEFINKYKLEL